MIDFKDAFYYDETSPSCLRWKIDVHTGIKYATKVVSIGDVAGSFGSKRYWRVRLDGKSYNVHRVIYQMFHGSLGKSQIDHVNGNTCDNRIENLRLVDAHTNARNRKKHSDNTSDVTGVHLYIGDGRYPCWRAKWRTAFGSDRVKSFSINKFGYEGAFQMACTHREEMIKELNEQGAGYTERHGE